MRRGTDVASTALLNLGGLALVLVAWVAVRRQGDFGSQLPFLNLAVGGVLVAAAGNIAYLLGFRRLVAARLRHLEMHPRFASGKDER